MCKVDQAWERAMLERFNGRTALSFDELFSRYFEPTGIPKQEVCECLRLLEAEYLIPVGVFRADDKLEKLLEPVPAKSPWQWLVFRTREGDCEMEINSELWKRMRQAGTIDSWSSVKSLSEITILDFVRAWSGFTS